MTVKWFGYFFYTKHEIFCHFLYPYTKPTGLMQPSPHVFFDAIPFSYESVFYWKHFTTYHNRLTKFSNCYVADYETQKYFEGINKYICIRQNASLSGVPVA